MKQALIVTDVRKTYAGGVEALKGVSLSIEEGDFFALLGPNGAGKTTLINILSGLVNKTSGELLVHGVSIDQDAAQAKMQVGVVPQEFNFGIFEKVLDIVLDQAGYYGISRRQVYPNAKKYLTQLGLWEKKDVQARELSGGMKRRLMIARGLVHDPKFLILDEPTAGVDIELRRGMWDFLRELNRNKGVTILLTTHYLDEAEELCRNMAIINRGEIVAAGRITDLLSSMENESMILELQSAPEEHTLADLAVFHPRMTEKSLSVTVNKQYSISQVMQLLLGAGLEVVSIRNTSNRLEEYFLQMTQKKSE
ncbi:MAG: ABC transporter ATP-binding protein [Candidatus Moranbacteria bacterium]|nr:ABC transporter ATP-binding protein [Candidatus Moranbacteria bacterium]